MAIQIPGELETELQQLAAEQGTSIDALTELAIRQYLDLHSLVLHSSVEKGIAAVERGEWIDHDELFDRLERRYSR
jgi:predicted transcriptional regulator